MNKVLQSLLITLGVSLCFGAIGYFSYDKFIPWFGISLVGQFLFFFIYNSILSRIENYNYLKMQNDLEIELEKNIMVLPCANCNHPNETHIDIKSSKNEFTCSTCKTQNSILVSVTNAQKTNVLYRKDILTENDIEGLRRADGKES